MHLLVLTTVYFQVYPFAGIAEATLPYVPRILFNKWASGTFVTNPRVNDVVAEGESPIIHPYF